MNELREIQIKHIISQARLMQQMYSNHECTADEIVSRTHNEQIIILADRIEELEKSTEVIAMLNAANIMDSQSELITELQRQVDAVREITCDENLPKYWERQLNMALYKAAIKERE